MNFRMEPYIALCLLVQFGIHPTVQQRLLLQRMKIKINRKEREKSRKKNSQNRRFFCVLCGYVASGLPCGGSAERDVAVNFIGVSVFVDVEFFAGECAF